jgi:hypothetical protein
MSYHGETALLAEYEEERGVRGLCTMKKEIVDDAFQLVFDHLKDAELLGGLCIKPKTGDQAERLVEAIHTYLEESIGWKE